MTMLFEEQPVALERYTVLGSPHNNRPRVVVSVVSILVACQLNIPNRVY